MLRVLYITNIPSPYRVKFFNELGRYCYLTVVYDRKIATNRDSKWFSAAETNFRSKYLKGFPIRREHSMNIGIIKYLLRNKFSQIIIGGYSSPTAMIAMLYLKLKKIPYILNADGGFIKKNHPLVYGMKKYFIGGASHYLSSGKITSQYLKYYGANPNLISEYPFTSLYKNEILDKPLSLEEKFILRKKLGIVENKIVLSVGQIIYRKGFDILLEAAKDLPEDTGIYIIGGKATDDLDSIRTRHLLKNVHFIDFIAPAIMKNYYLASDLFVLPTREDIWGLVINEAMSNALPVITTDKCIAGLELIKNNMNGLIIPSNSPIALSEAILSIIKSPRLLEMSLNNLALCQNYTIEKMALKHFNIIETLSSCKAN